MTIQPETQKSIFERIKSAIVSASNLTNFSDNSPEKAITDDGFSAEMRERQHELLHVQLSSRVDYAGKEITKEDLDDLGVDPEKVDLELLNEYQSSDDLDEFAKRNSIYRDPGSFATGTVTFQTTSDSVTISEGTEVGTQPDGDNEYLSYYTTEEVSPSTGLTSVDAPVKAEERGAEYNVGNGEVTYLPSPPPGVSGDPPVNNNASITGGENEEADPELRKRTQEALVGSSGGGTLGGVENGLVAAFDGLDDGDVVIREYTNSSPVTFDYVVDGGPTDTELQSKIDTLRPLAIEGTLVRPTTISLNVTADVVGTDVDTAIVKDEIIEFLNGLGLDANMSRDKLIATIIVADSDIDDIDSLSTTIVDETFTYDSTQSIYTLSKEPYVSGSVANVDDASGNTYVNGTDYSEVDNDGDGNLDSIDWSVNTTTPDDGEDFFVDYEVPDNITVGSREKIEPNAITVNVV